MSKAKDRYNAKNYFQISIRIPREKKPILDELAETKHKSINRIFIDAVEQQYNVDLTLMESKLVDSE